MQATQEALFPLTHEHVYRVTQGPYAVQGEITTAEGHRWCWTCNSWVTLYRNGEWLNWTQKEAAGFTWRDELKRG